MPTKTTSKAQKRDAEARDVDGEARDVDGETSLSQGAQEPEKEAITPEAKSVTERARPYLLAVAKMPFGVFTTHWTVGRNRCVDLAHARELKAVFRRMGAERLAREHHLRVLCRAEEVQRMKSQADVRGEEEPVEDFLAWASVNPGKVEVMAGQHRIQAFRDYAQEAGLPESELWWTCELYDQDSLPHDLNIKLRVNRRDPSLPDNQGQVWSQLVSMTSQGDSLSLDEGPRVTIKLVEALRIGGDKTFPTRKLITLWNNLEWRDITTRWCRTRLGLETLNISTFEWFASLRVDEYWFAAMESALETLEALPVDPTRDLGKEDWSRLVTAVGDHRTPSSVRKAFYLNSNPSRKRRTPGFLPSLDDTVYEDVYRVLSARLDLKLPDIKEKLRPRKAELPYMVRALQHVVGWIDMESALAIGEVKPKSKNKPLVRTFLLKALRTLAASRGQKEPADEVAVRLEEAVLDFVDTHMHEFKAAERAIPTECEAIHRIDDGDYTGRFAIDVWARLLHLVRGFTDRKNHLEVLRPEWGAASSPGRRGSSVLGSTGRQARLLSLTETFCADIAQLVDDSAPITGGVRSAIRKGIEDLLSLHLDGQTVGQENTGERHWRPTVSGQAAPASISASRKRIPPPIPPAGAQEQKRRRYASAEERTPVAAETAGETARRSPSESSDTSKVSHASHASHSPAEVSSPQGRSDLSLRPPKQKQPSWKQGVKVGGARGAGARR